MGVKKWGTKPYYSLDYYFKSIYGQKIYKIALNAGTTCPNRDGVIDTRGCIFCSEGGSGDFAEKINEENPDIKMQIEAGKLRIQSKITGGKYVAYFQAYTGTYAPVDYLRGIYTDALSDEDIVGISIATRPDCLSEDVLSLLADLQADYPDKFIWIELGLQTIHRKTAVYIRRGYELTVFEDAVRKLRSLQIPIIVHVILGLPGESVDDMLATIEYLNTFQIFGIKLQLLHVLKNTDLATDYYDKKFDALSMDEYIDIVIRCLTHLSPDIVIHRVTGDGPRNILIAPLWSTDKKVVLNTLLKEMEDGKYYQGMNYENSGFFNVI